MPFSNVKFAMHGELTFACISEFSFVKLAFIHVLLFADSVHLEMCSFFCARLPLPKF